MRTRREPLLRKAIRRRPMRRRKRQAIPRRRGLAAPPAEPVEVKSPAHLACERKGGRGSTAGSSAAAFCQNPTRDGGKQCRKASDCEGYCLAKSNTCAPVIATFRGVMTSILTEEGRDVDPMHKLILVIAALLAACTPSGPRTSLPDVPSARPVRQSGQTRSSMRSRLPGRWRQAAAFGPAGGCAPGGAEISRASPSPPVFALAGKDLRLSGPMEPAGPAGSAWQGRSGG